MSVRFVGCHLSSAWPEKADIAGANGFGLVDAYQGVVLMSYTQRMVLVGAECPQAIVTYGA